MKPRVGDLCVFSFNTRLGVQPGAWFIIHVNFENVWAYGYTKQIEQCNVIGLSCSAIELKVYQFAWWEPYEWHNMHLTARLDG